MLCPCGEVQVRQCVVKVMGGTGARQFYAGSRLLTLIAVAISYLGFKSGSPRRGHGGCNKLKGTRMSYGWIGVARLHPGAVEGQNLGHPDRRHSRKLQEGC